MSVTHFWKVTKVMLIYEINAYGSTDGLVNWNWDYNDKTKYHPHIEVQKSNFHAPGTNTGMILSYHTVTFVTCDRQPLWLMLSVTDSDGQAYV